MTEKQLNRVRNYTNEDSLRRTLMMMDRRDLVELYLELRFEKNLEKEKKS